MLTWGSEMTPGMVRDLRVVFNEEKLTSASISGGSRGTLTAGTLQAGGFLVILDSYHLSRDLEYSLSYDPALPIFSSLY